MAESASPSLLERWNGRSVTARVGHVLAAVAMVATALAVAPPTPATAQNTVPVLVSNQDQTAGTALATASGRASYAQSFTTGDNIHGYTLSSAEIGVSAASGVTVRVRLLSDDSGPDTALATLTTSATIGTTVSTKSFAAHDVLLEPNTTYWIEVAKTAGADTGMSVATTTDETGTDSATLAGWSVGDNAWAYSSSTWSDHSATSDVNLKIRLRGRPETTSEPGPYVSNRQFQERSTVAKTSSTTTKYATRFSPGWNPDGDTLDITSVVLSVAAESGTTPRVAIHATTGSAPGSPASNPVTNGTLTAPAGISTDLDAPDRAVFRASPALTLRHGLWYWLVVDVGSGSGNVSVGTTASDSWDEGSLSGTEHLGHHEGLRHVVVRRQRRAVVPHVGPRHDRQRTARLLGTAAGRPRVHGPDFRRDPEIQDHVVMAVAAQHQQDRHLHRHPRGRRWPGGHLYPDVGRSAHVAQSKDRVCGRIPPVRGHCADGGAAGAVAACPVQRGPGRLRVPAPCLRASCSHTIPRSHRHSPPGRTPPGTCCAARASGWRLTTRSSSR